MKKLTKRIGSVAVTAGAVMSMLLTGATSASAADSSIALSSSTPNYSCGTQTTWWSNSVHLTFQCDGNLVLYRNSDGHAMWASGTYRSPTPNTLDFSHLGWIELDSATYGCKIGSWPNQAPEGRAVVQDDGNFVIYNTSGVATWSSGTYNNQQGKVDECYS
ncbi:hypothetical protein P3T37_004694 [Kitasatospora sp. MAA4]|uniref:hypothetical protein n=1 Tax=Kitasatospora sp. MAA4 TaxID=3035093 RepID=UPI0024740B07|nr:hypothetical protein [Kitasatospora sp. MAA4]MDH6135284.1 hypothetical protein [Kitasatospora sp. MAA4]